MDENRAINYLEEQLNISRQRAQQALQELQAIQNTISWKATAPIRNILNKFPRIKKICRRTLKLIWWTITLQLPKKIRQRYSPQSVSEPVANPVMEKEIPSPSKFCETITPTNKEPYIIYIIGDPTTPGAIYRVHRYVEAAIAAGFNAIHFTPDKVMEHLDQIEKADIVIIWRSIWSECIEAVINITKSSGARIIFDADDLIVEPDLAKIEAIDGIRSQKFTEESFYRYFTFAQKIYSAADFCTAPTAFLASRMRRNKAIVWVLPNGFDAQTLRSSRLAVRHRKKNDSDNLIRIGYAGGTLTHQRDFAQIAPVIARVLQEHPECRLVLFKQNDLQLLEVSEFPVLQPVLAQIEWRSYVPLPELPDEIARFDINLAPLEVDNLFCNAKSELKYFESALVNVPTIASPTEPFLQAIQHEVTGFLAHNSEEWYETLIRLVNESELRQRIGQAAFYDVLWKYGPERRIELMKLMVEQICYDDFRAAHAFELSIIKQLRRFQQPQIPEHKIEMEIDTLKPSQVTVIIPMYNYGHCLVEALESVKAQTIADLDLILIDDASSDNSLDIALRWIKRNSKRFNRIVLAQNLKYSGSALTRNTGFHLAETPFVLPFDSDYLLLPDCAQSCLKTIGHAAFAYPIIQKFGDLEYTIGNVDYHGMLFVGKNHIDAMALIRKAAWVAVGGFSEMELGWEDYDLWCKFAEVGLFGDKVPQTLAHYRVHQKSMCQTVTDLPKNKQKIVAEMTARHSWLQIEEDGSLRSEGSISQAQIEVVEHK